MFALPTFRLLLHRLKAKVSPILKKTSIESQPAQKLTIGPKIETISLKISPDGL